MLPDFRAVRTVRSRAVSREAVFRPVFPQSWYSELYLEKVWHFEKISHFEIFSHSVIFPDLQGVEAGPAAEAGPGRSLSVGQRRGQCAPLQELHRRLQSDGASRSGGFPMATTPSLGQIPPLEPFPLVENAFPEIRPTVPWNLPFLDPPQSQHRH